MMINNELILERINHYIEKEGYRKERLAKKLGKAPSSVYAHLNGRHPKTTAQFAVELAIVLGLSPSFFIKENVEDIDYSELDLGLNISNISFSVGQLGLKGQEGLEQIGKLCDLLEIYN